MTISNTREELVSKIIEEAIRIDLMPVEDKESWLEEGRDGIIVPRLPTHRGGVLHTTLAGQIALDSLVDDFMRSESSSEDFVRSKVEASVRKVCGELVSQGVFKRNSIETITKMVEIYVFGRTQAPPRTLVHYVPCMLWVDGETEAPFRIGPISFVPRSHFENMLAVDGNTGPWSSLAGNSHSKEVAGDDWATLQSALAGSNWVAWSVDTDSDYERSREDTLVNVELAIYCLQLAFDHNSLRIVRHKWERRPSPMRQRLFHFEGHSKLLKMQIFSEAGADALNGFGRIMMRKESFFRCAGERILSATSSGLDAHCRNISERWLTALFWFGKSIREDLDAAAIIALGASLDIFGRSTGKIQQMLIFCSGLLGMKDEEFVFESKITLKKMVELVYSDGRSQLIHGSKSVLKSDYSEMRQLCEGFVRLVLIRALERIDDYAKLRAKDGRVRDSFDDFIKFVISRRPV